MDNPSLRSRSRAKGSHIVIRERGPLARSGRDACPPSVGALPRMSPDNALSFIEECSMENRIVIDPEIQHGKPVIGGTRVPVVRISWRASRWDDY